VILAFEGSLKRKLASDMDAVKFEEHEKLLNDAQYKLQGLGKRTVSTKKRCVQKTVRTKNKTVRTKNHAYKKQNGAYKKRNGAFKKQNGAYKIRTYSSTL
jgi:hypothetical protein